MSPDSRNSKVLSEESNYKIVALFITLILWIVILSAKDAELSKVVQVKYILPAGLAIAGPFPKDIKMAVKGRRLSLNKFFQNMNEHSVDLSGYAESLVSIQLREDSFDPPQGIRVVSVWPAYIRLRLEEVISKELPVEVVIKPGSFHGQPVVLVDPTSVKVTGVKSLVSELKSIPTEMLDLIDVGYPAEMQVELKDAGTGISLSHKGAVSVRIQKQ